MLKCELGVQREVRHRARELDGLTERDDAPGAAHQVIVERSRAQHRGALSTELPALARELELTGQDPIRGVAAGGAALATAGERRKISADRAWHARLGHAAEGVALAGDT